jgi:hypothetical protein
MAAQMPAATCRRRIVIAVLMLRKLAARNVSVRWGGGSRPRVIG